MPTLDILEEINDLLGHRLSLNHLAEKTLARTPQAGGVFMLRPGVPGTPVALYKG